MEACANQRGIRVVSHTPSGTVIDNGKVQYPLKDFGLDHLKFLFGVFFCADERTNNRASPFLLGILVGEQSSLVHRFSLVLLVASSSFTKGGHDCMFVGYLGEAVPEIEKRACREDEESAHH